jgi:tRNA(Ile)-lysidine synthase
MDASGKRPRSDLLAEVRARLGPHLAAGARLTVGLSGGLDSVVLLDLLARLRASLDFTLDALHVHHGLSASADRWAEHAASVAAAQGVACRVERADCSRHRRLGLEGAARAARYQAYARCRSDVVALAHHCDDQAETLLVQLVRGASVAGLAAMPDARRLGARGPLVVRPLLGVRRTVLLEHAREHGLRWVEDDSNADPLRTRSFLRHRVLPVLASLRPGVVEALARSARQAAEASELVDALAEIDAAACLRGDRLVIARLLELPHARARNVLRWHVAAQVGTAVEGAPVDELLRQLASPRPDATLEVVLGAEARARRYAGELWLEVAPPPDPPPDFVARWEGARDWALPALGGRLRFETGAREGLSCEALERGAEVRLRRGGERLQVRAGGPRRALKDLLQEAQVPPWERGRLPLLYCGGELAWVARIGMDVRFAAPPGARACGLTWDCKGP